MTFTTLDANVCEGDGVLPLDLDRTDAVLAVGANEAVRMRRVRSVVRDTRYDNNGDGTFEVVNPNLRKRLLLGRATLAQYTASRPSLALVAEPKSSLFRLLDYFHPGRGRLDVDSHRQVVRLRVHRRVQNGGVRRWQRNGRV